jgi:hypothetical protein
MIGRRTVCPSCTGAAVWNQNTESIKCIDCGDLFKIKGQGQTEREFVCMKEA